MKFDVNLHTPNYRDCEMGEDLHFADKNLVYRK